MSRKFGIVIESPPCDTYSRAPYSGHPGPKPLRSAQWPRGLPGLPPAAVARVRNANSLSDFAVEILHAAGEAGCISLLESPEDLGPSMLGAPASLWQRSDMKELSKWGYERGALYQSDSAPVLDRRFASLFASSIPCCLAEGLCRSPFRP